MKKILNVENTPVLILEVLFVLYILIDVGTPVALAKMVDNTIGKITIMMFVLSIFYAAGPIVGILAMFAAYSIITRASRATGSIYKQPEYEAEEIKMKFLREHNSTPKTLEEDVITEMSPIIRDEGGMTADYKPVLGNLNNAASLDNMGLL